MVDAALHQHVQDAAMSAGMDVAPWLCHLLRRITHQDFPRSWQTAAEVICQLIAQATPEDFPESWRVAMVDRQV
jgi:hypothetical protein